MSNPHGQTLPANPSIADIDSGRYDHVLEELVAAVVIPVKAKLDAALAASTEPDRQVLASEKRLADSCEATVAAIRRRQHLVNAQYAHQRAEHERRELAHARAYTRLFGDGSPQARGPIVGTAIREGIEDVLSGRLSTAQVPLEVRGSLTESGDWGNGVPTEIGPTQTTLRARSVVMSIPGVHIVPMTSDKLVYPRLGESTAEGIVEAAPFDTDDPALDLIVLNAVKFGVLTQLSSEVEEDFNEDALQLLADNMLKELALKVDAQLLEGVGAGPGLVGIRNWPGISTTSVAGVPSNFAKLREVEYELEAADADVDNAVWLLHPRSWWTLASIKTGLSGDETTLLEPNPQDTARSLLGHPVKSSTQITLTEGAGAGSWVGLVDGSQLVVGERTAPRVEISRDFAFDKDLITLRAKCRYGFAIVNPGAVSIATDVRAS